MKRFAKISLPDLPAPDALETQDYETVLAILTGLVTGKWPEFSSDVESEPVLILMQAMAEHYFVKMQEWNDGVRGLMLASAQKADLEGIAAAMGTARLPGETDDALRRRAQLAWGALSNAGTRDAYLYHASSAHEDVADVQVISPAPGQVEISVLGAEGDGSPSEDVLSAVRAAVTRSDVRALCDTVTVRAAEIVPYALTAVLRVAQGPDPDVVGKAAEASALKAVTDAHCLQGGVILSALYAALHQPGVLGVSLIDPLADIATEPHQAPYCTAVSVTVEVSSG